MYEVELLCDDVGIISQGKLAAFDTPQGLKDTMIKEIKEENSRVDSNVSEVLEKILEETDPEDKKAVEYITSNMGNNNLNLKELSVMISNKNEEMLNTLNNLSIVHDVVEHASGRITMDIEDSDESVSEVISDIIEHGGNITSIATKDPSLEDVFMRVLIKRNKQKV
jgi:ABC-2 type transport system ATP-binding protein